MMQGQDYKVDASKLLNQVLFFLKNFWRVAKDV